MEERILGTEVEFALFYQPEEKTTRRLGGDALLDHLNELSALLFSSLKRNGCLMAGEFLANGGRLYIDRGAHPEYATPECRSVREAVAYEKAGERIVQDLVKAARRLILQQGGSGKLSIFKNNVDYFGNTYGSHENYLVSPLSMQKTRLLIPFLVSRQIYTGAGKVAKRWEPGEVPFQVSQRADFIEQVFSDRATQVRGIINTRRRELYREGQNMRLHVIVGDSNMSEYAIGLKMGATGIVLRLLEEGALDDIPSLSLPVQDLRRISRSFKAALRVEGRSRKYSALDIQSMYLEKAYRFFGSRRPNREEEFILKLWERTLAGLEKLKISATWDLEEDPGDLKRKIDWVLKLWLLNRFRKKDGLDWNDVQLKSLDFRYHDLDPEAGLFERCQAMGLVDRVVDEEEINRARVDPPKNTRAWTRGMIIRKTANTNVNVQIENWEKITLFSNRRRREVVTVVDRTRRIVNALGLKLEDPFLAQNVPVLRAVERFIETWE